MKRKISRLKSIQFTKFEGKSDNEIAAMIAPSGDAFLRSREWVVLRDKAIATYGAKCMKCGFTERKTPRGRIHVDHIKCRKHCPELALDFDNLQVLCATCNKAKGNKHSTDYRTLSGGSPLAEVCLNERKLK